MTDTSASRSGSPHEVLASTRDLARTVRNAQRGTWFPLLLFGVVTLLAGVVDRLGYGHNALTCRSFVVAGGAGRICTVYNTWSAFYWPVALTLAYVAIAGFYLRRARSRGVGTRIQPYVVAGILLAVVLTVASLWAAHHPPGSETDFLGLHLSPQSWLRTFPNRLESPASAIGLALLVLSRVERSVSLLVVTVGYLLIVLVPIDFGWVIAHPSPWAFLPHLVITGAVLLLAGSCFALTQRPTS
jgi:hypothetical protein